MAANDDLLQILQWNKRSWPTSATLVHENFERKASEQPNAPAVFAWDGNFLYRELDTITTRLASYLKTDYSVGPEVLVPVSFFKSKWYTVAMLSVLKAGGACVPADPKNPTGRLLTISEKLGSQAAACVLTDAENADHVSAGFKIKSLVIDQKLIDNLSALNVTTDFTTSGSQTSPPNTATLDNTAFVVFTSGSTGAPKGVVIPHRASSTSAFAHGRPTYEPNIKQGISPRVLQFAAHTFDVSNKDIFTTLAFGGCVCVPSEDDRLNDLVGFVQRAQCTHLILTPSTVAALLTPQDVPSVKVLRVGGELLSRDVVDLWAPHVRILNCYGPAECCINASIKNGFDVGDEPSNIGTSVGGNNWLVDPEDHNKLMPIGEVGEILIEGPIVARGYLNDKEQTDKAFINDPTWARSSDGKTRRFYKTGDLAKYNPDGTMTILGRNDGQAKLNGQRMEMGEIEYQLKLAVSEPVAAAVVQVSGGPKELAAFIAMKGSGLKGTQQHLDAMDIFDDKKTMATFFELVSVAIPELENNLPSFMLPTAYIPIWDIPRNTSFKIDRKELQRIAMSLSPSQLASLGREKESTQTTVQPPTTDRERILHEIWTEMFPARTEISVGDCFTTIGGDSLAAMLLVRLAKARGLLLSVGLIFSHPVLRDLAERAKLRSLDSDGVITDIAPYSLISGSCTDEFLAQCHVVEGTVEDIYPVTSLQELMMRGAFFGGKDSYSDRRPKLPRDEQETMVFSIPADIDLDKLAAALKTVVKSHDILRTRIIETTLGMMQVVLNCDIPIERSTATIEDFVSNDRLNAMTFGDPLLRLAFVCPEADPNHQRFLVVTMVHAIYDGFSLSFLFEDLTTEYNTPGSLMRRKQMKHLVSFLHAQNLDKEEQVWKDWILPTEPGRACLLERPIADYDRTHRRILDKTRRKVTLDIPDIGTSTTITLSTVIQVSAALAVAAHIQDKNDGQDLPPYVIFEALISGRYSHDPQHDFSDLAGPTLMSVPLRINLGTGTTSSASDPPLTIKKVLLETQNVIHGDLAEPRRLGWWDLATGDNEDLAKVLGGVPQLNVNPNRAADLGGGLGMRRVAVGPQNDNEVFFAMSSMGVGDGKIYLMTSSDDAVVPAETAELCLERWSTAFRQIASLCLDGADIPVDELLTTLRDFQGQGSS